MQCPQCQQDNSAHAKCWLGCGVRLALACGFNGADRSYTKQYSVALQLMKDLPYAKWRDYDPEDTVRFYGLRLYELGMVRSHPKNRPGHRLALRQRAHEGTEGLT